MIVFEKKYFDEILEHLRKEFPNEGCGLLAGSGRAVGRVYPMKNAEASPVSFCMDPREELSVFKHMRQEGLELVGIYHSHPGSEAYPSEKDRALAFYDQAFYLIVSLKNPDCPETRVFWIREGKIEEDKIGWAG